MVINKLIKKHLKASIKEERIVCSNCSWSWDLSDGGNDPYVCHKCGKDNSKKYNDEKNS